MPNLSELFSTLCQRAGVKIDNPELVAILSNPEISKVPVPDALKVSIESGLHTLESARTVLKKEIENAVRAEAYNGVDAEIYGLASEHGLPDEFVDTLKPKDMKTSQRLKAVAAKIKELAESKVGATGKDKKDLVDQIDALKLEQGKLAKAHQDALNASKAGFEKEINDMAINSHVGRYAYNTEDGTPVELKAMYVRSELDKKLAELEATPIYDKTTGKIKLTKADGTGVFDASNNPIDFYGISDSIVAEKKLIQTSKGSQGNNGNGNQDSKGSGGQGATGGNSSSFDEAYARALNDVAQSS